MFKFAEGRGSLDSLYCGPDGLYLGSAALIELRDATYFLRHEDDIAALLAAAYDPTPAFGILIPRLRAITDHLQRGELAQAMVAAVLLRLDDLSGAAIARVAQVDALLKHNFNPDEPRDSHGRWTDGTESDPPETGTSSSAQQHPPDERGAERPPDLTPISNRTISGIASWYDLPGHRMSNGQMVRSQRNERRDAQGSAGHARYGLSCGRQLTLHPGHRHGSWTLYSWKTHRLD
jgi:hypothetical protein